MALNVQGFPLEFDAVINTDTLELSIQSTRDNIDQLFKTIEASGLKTDKVFEDLKNRFNDLDAAQKTLQASLAKSTDPSANQAYIQSLELIKSEMRDVAEQIRALPNLPVIEPKVTLPPIDISGAEQSIKTLINNFVQLGASGSQSINKLSTSLDLSTEIDQNKILLQSLDDLISRVGDNSDIGKLAAQFTELNKSQSALKESLATASDPVQITRLNDQLLVTQDELKKVSQQILDLPAPKIEVPTITVPPVEVKINTESVSEQIKLIQDNLGKLKDILIRVDVDENIGGIADKIKLVENNLTELKNSFQTVDIKANTGTLDEQLKTTRANIDNLKIAFENIGQGANPVLQSLITEFTDLSTQIKAVPPVVTTKVDVQVPPIPPIEADIKISTTSLSEQLNNVQTNIDSLKDAFNSIGLAADPVLKELINKFGDLEKSAVVFNDAIKNTSDPVKLKQYSQELDVIKTQLTEVGNKITSFPTASLRFADTGDAKAQINEVTNNVQQLIAALGQIPGQADPSLNALIEKFGELQKQQILFKDELSKTSDNTAQQKLLASLNETEGKLKSLAEQINQFPQIKVSGGLDVAPIQADIKSLLSDYVQLGVSGSGSLTKISEGFVQSDKQIVDTKQSLDDVTAKLTRLGDNAGITKLNTQFSSLLQQQISLNQQLSKTSDPVTITKLKAELQNTNIELKKVGDQILNFPTVPDETPHVEKSIQAYQRLRQIKNDLVRLTLEGQKGSPEFEKLNEEAEHLTNAIRNTNTELTLSAHNVAGLQAIKESVRGLVGGFEAVAGAISLFGGDSKQAEEATRAVIGAMGILNGIEEVAALLSKNSAVNFYLQGLAHKAAAAGAAEQGVAEKALTIEQEIANAQKVQALAVTRGISIAEAEQAVATEGAAAAQKGLNLAMLANPVGAILTALVALFGAYEIYIHTLGRATDAEKSKADAAENAKEVQDKAIDGYVKEEAALNSLVGTAKNQLLTRKQQQSALDELKEKFPGYLANLTLENISTAKSIELLRQQTELIKSRAVAQAAGDVYAEKLKEVSRLQNEFNDITESGSSLLKKLYTANSPADLFNNQEVLKQKQKEIDEATRKANIAFDQQNEALTKNAELVNSDADAIKLHIQQLDNFIAKSDGYVKAIAQMIEAGEKARLGKFNIDDFAKEKKLMLENAQYQIDVDKNSFAAKRNLIQVTYDEELKRIKGIYGESQKAGDAADQASKVAHGKYLSDINALNVEASAKSYRDQVAAADAVVIALKAAGKEGTDAFYNARIVAIRAAANEAIHQEGITAGEIKKINAQLNLDLRQLELDREKSAIQRQRDAIAAQLNLVKEGSKQELALKLQDIGLASQQELDALGLTQQKKQEILTKAAKAISDLNKAFVFQGLKEAEDIQIANIEKQLFSVQKGSSEELHLREQLVIEKAKLDVISANESIKNEALKLAKIAEINAKAREDERRLNLEFIKQRAQDELNQIDLAAKKVNAPLQNIIDDKSSSVASVFDARKKLIDREINDLTAKISVITAEIIETGGREKGLSDQVDELNIKIEALRIKAKNLDKEAELSHFANIANQVNVISSAFASLSDNIIGANTELGALVKTFAGVGAAAASAINSIGQLSTATKDFRKATTAAEKATAFKDEVTAGLGIFGAFFGVVSTINNLINSAAQKRAQLKAVEEQMLNNVVIGEVAVNDEYRKRLVIQSQINKLKLDAIKAEADALRLNSQTTLDDFNRVLTEIQERGKVAIPEGFTAAQIATIKNFKTLGLSNELTKAFDEATSLANKSFDDLQRLFLEGRLDESASKLFQTLQQLKNEGIDIDAALEANRQKAQEIFTGTTADNIVDSIADGFSQGFKSVQDFAGKTEDILRGAIINALKTQALEAPIKKLFEQFAKDAESGGGLDLTEVANFTKSINQTISDAEKFAEEVQKATGINISKAATTNANSLQGSIRASLTENTGTVLAGQMGGIRLIGIEQLNTVKNCFNSLNRIADNTDRLAAIENYMRRFDTDGMKIK